MNVGSKKTILWIGMADKKYNDFLLPPMALRLHRGSQMFGGFFRSGLTQKCSLCNKYLLFNPPIFYGMRYCKKLAIQGANT